MILDRYRLVHKSWRFRTSSLPLPSVVAVDHHLIKKHSLIPCAYTGLAGSQAERNGNKTKTERKEDGTELNTVRELIPFRENARRTIIRRSSNISFLITGTVGLESRPTVGVQKLCPYRTRTTTAVHRFFLCTQCTKCNSIHTSYYAENRNSPVPYT